MTRDFNERRRDAEAALDRLAESSDVTGGDLGPTEMTVRVADDLFDYIAGYCLLEPAIRRTSRGVAWREASGNYRGIKIRLATAAKRYLVPA